MDQPSWVQLAFTEGRLVVVRMGASRIDGAFRVSSRFTIDKSLLQIAIFPRTPSAPARLEIVGGEDMVVVTDIDRPEIHSRVEPFLAAWGGQTTGAGRVLVADQLSEAGLGGDNRMLFMALIIGVVFMALCCGCSMLGTLIGSLL